MLLPPEPASGWLLNVPACAQCIEERQNHRDMPRNAKIFLFFAAALFFVAYQAHAEWKSEMDLKDFSFSTIGMQDFNHGHWLSGVSKTIWELDRCLGKNCQPLLTATPFEAWDFESEKTAFGVAIGLQILPLIGDSAGEMFPSWSEAIEKIQRRGSLQFAVCPSQYSYDRLQNMAYGFIAGIKIL